MKYVTQVRLGTAYLIPGIPGPTTNKGQRNNDRRGNAIRNAHFQTLTHVIGALRIAYPAPHIVPSKYKGQQKKGRIRNTQRKPAKFDTRNRCVVYCTPCQRHCPLYKERTNEVGYDIR